ncbi:hypothetical protein ABT160_29705 [Streptomyces sp. NPDC001941]|uniref:hypothetical protein n=1 Tax=Streptomyces sp. NPDC001941 TaxID=3154659 RepID=UPI0033252A4C
MGGFLDALGGRLAERWLSLLVLPGAVYLAVAATAATLGQGHALDVPRLVRHVTRYAASPQVTSGGAQVVLLAAVLLGAAVLGLAARAAGAVLERLALGAGWRRWPRPWSTLARRTVVRRRDRWHRAHARWHREWRAARAPRPADRPDPAARHRAAHHRDRIAVERPDRLTWSGDRVHAAALRLGRDSHLDLAVVWPHLWLSLPDTVRAEVTAGRDALARAAGLGAWALLYAPLAPWWWPAAPLAAVLALTARSRFRAATDTYASLLEAATRLHAPALATQLGIAHEGVLDPRLGRRLTDLLGNRLPPP